MSKRDKLLLAFAVLFALTQINALLTTLNVHNLEERIAALEQTIQDMGAEQKDGIVIPNAGHP